MTAAVGLLALGQPELAAAAAPIMDAVTEHPFWTGLADETLPPESLVYFVEQDTRYVVPAYARALSRCAAIAEHDPHATLLCAAGQATFGSLPRLRSEMVTLAAATGVAMRGAQAEPAPAVRAYASFMLAAPVRSFAAGVGGLLPMTWFHLLVSTNLRRACEAGSRYAAWIDQFRALPGFEDYVATYLHMVDEVGERCSAEEWADLVEHFSIASRYELAFADAAWQCQDWPA